MGLMDTLNQCISAGHEMTKAIAIAQFNDDSPEADAGRLNRYGGDACN